MELKNLYEKKYIIEQHPYIFSLLVCIGVWAFTYGDQKLLSGTAVAVLAFLTIIQLFRKFIAQKKAAYVKFASASIFSVAVAVFFSLSPFKGSMLLLTGIACILLMYLKYKKALFEPDNLRLLIMSFAFLLYISYILFTYCTLRQMDVGYIHNGSGHFAYIEYLYDHAMMLPYADPRGLFQMYQPPLFYYIAAVVVRITTLFGVPYENALESVQIVTLYATVCTVITADKIFRKFRLKGYALAAALALTCFGTGIIIISGMINNDMLSIAFETGAVFCALEWYDNRTTKNIINTALCIGLGMMSKLSAVVVAPPIAVLFIYVFFRELKNMKTYLKQFAAFLGVSVPLGMWFPVKNLILFGVPLGCVPEGMYSEYMESIPVWQRIFDFGWQNFAYPITVNCGGSLFDKPVWFEDYNPVIALIKSNVDMQMMRDKGFLSTILYIQFYIMLILAVVGFAYMIYCLFSKNMKHIFMSVFWLSIMVSYYIFCINYPNIYAENIRYVFDIIIVNSLYVGLFLNDSRQNKILRHIRYLLYPMIITYTLFSVFIWAGLSFYK